MIQPDELHRALIRFGLRSSELAKLLGVTPRAIDYWLSGTRSIPGPVAAYLRLLGDISNESRRAELGRVFETRRVTQEDRL